MNIDLKKAEEITSSYSGQKGALIPVLQKIQEEYGYLPEDAIKMVSDKLGMTTAEIFGVATFYTQFRLSPVGKYIIKVCHGTACHVGGANILDEMIKNKLRINFGETTSDGLFTTMSVACLGCCSLAPAIMINDTTYGKLNNDKLVNIIDQYAMAEKNKS